MPNIKRMQPSVESAKKMLWRNAKFLNKEARKSMLYLVNSGKIEEFITILTLATIRGRLTSTINYT